MYDTSVLLYLTVALYIMFSVRHLFLIGQSFGFKQLHVFSGCMVSGFWLRILVLWLVMCCSMLLGQLKDTLTVCLFNILCRGLFLGKFLSTSLRNSLPKLVFTLMLKGGLYQRICLRLVCLFVVFGVASSARGVATCC